MSKIKSYIKTFALWELLRGLSVTLRQFFSNSVTLEYPEEKTPQSHRFVETRIHEYHMEKPGENIMTKDKLLAVGDKYDAMISADKAADAKYR